MLFDFKAFRPLEVKDRELFIDYLTRFPTIYCDYSFTNLIAWGESSGVLWQEADNHLYIYFSAIDALLFPVGSSLSPAELKVISDSLKMQGKPGVITSVNPEYIQNNRTDLQNFFIIEEDADYQDYVYLTAKLANLPGKKLQKKKNLISQFKRLYPDYTAEPLRPEDRNECLKLTDLWTELNSVDDPYLQMETAAIHKAWDFFNELKIQGMVIRVNNEMAAFSMYSWLSPAAADVHFEKYNRNIKGAGQIINQETALNLQGQFQYLNREQDMQLEGLRQAKMSYEPELLLKAFRLTPL